MRIRCVALPDSELRAVLVTGEGPVELRSTRQAEAWRAGRKPRPTRWRPARSCFKVLRSSILLCSFTSYAAAQTVSGTVVNAVTNKPVPGAIVTAIRTTTPPLSERAPTPADGSFQLAGLPAATYRICVQVPAGGYLNPCTWTPNPTTITLTAGRPATGLTLKLIPGSKVSVFIADPSNVLSQAGKSGQAPPVSMGVRTPLGIVEPFIMRSASKSGSQHEATIPFDSAVPVWIHSAKLSLTQVGAAAVPAAGLSLPVTHSSASAAAPPLLQFQITGVKP